MNPSQVVPSRRSAISSNQVERMSVFLQPLVPMSQSKGGKGAGNEDSGQIISPTQKNTQNG
ncbi:hypothetical protein E2C01_072165 [Portunus trituberculatus]|uniref:Uncharacterized protein n=1 Tax=Portunus trituberculatus TaxID=210409 RepID=A0A5B7I603_PORTR|nr:hypothetical protein [Portunus trituberculatus]